MEQKRPTTRKTPTDGNEPGDTAPETTASGAASTEHDDAMAASREEHVEIRKALETVTGSGGSKTEAPNDDRAWDRIAALSLRHFDIEDATLLEHLSERDETREAACRFRVMHDLARILIANLREGGQPREAIRAKRTVLAQLLKVMFESEEDDTGGIAAMLRTSGLEQGNLAEQTADRRRDESRSSRQRPRLSVLRLDQLEGIRRSVDAMTIGSGSPGMTNGVARTRHRAKAVPRICASATATSKVAIGACPNATMRTIGIFAPAGGGPTSTTMTTGAARSTVG